MKFYNLGHFNNYCIIIMKIMEIEHVIIIRYSYMKIQEYKN